MCYLSVMNLFLIWFFRPPEFSGNYSCSHIVAKQEELGERNVEFGLTSIFVHTSKVFWTYWEILRYGAHGFTSPPKKSVLWIFILKNPSSSAGF
jgi:hypothetical protein